MKTSDLYIIPIQGGNMKKLLLTALLMLPVTLIAAVSITTDNVNAVLTEILAPYQDNKTKVGVEFSELQYNKDSLEKVSLKGWLYREGLVNTFNLMIPQLEYDYTNKNDPQLLFRGSLDLNLLKVMGQKNLNEISAEVEDEVENFGAEMLKEYGTAAEVHAKVLDKQVDKDGNYQVVKIELNLSVDKSKLPNNIPSSSLAFTQVSSTLKLTTTKIEADVKINFNPDYSGYGNDVEGLKKHLEALLNHDQDTISEIQGIVDLALGYLEEILNKDRSK